MGYNHAIMPSATHNSYIDNGDLACLVVHSDNPRTSASVCAAFESTVLPRVRSQQWARSNDDIITTIEGFEVSLVAFIGAEYDLYTRHEPNEDYTLPNFCKRVAPTAAPKPKKTKDKAAELYSSKIFTDRMPRTKYKRSNLEDTSFQVTIYSPLTKDLTPYKVYINKAHSHLLNCVCLYDKRRGLIGHTTSGKPEYIDARIYKEIGATSAPNRLDLLDYRIDGSNRFVSRRALKHKYYTEADVTIIEIIQQGHTPVVTKRDALEGTYDYHLQYGPNVFEWYEAPDAPVTSIFAAIPSSLTRELSSYDWRFNRAHGAITAVFDDGISKWTIDLKRKVAELSGLDIGAGIKASKMTSGYEKAVNGGESRRAMMKRSKYEHTENSKKISNNAMFTISRAYKYKKVSAEKFTFFHDFFAGLGIIALDLRPEALKIGRTDD